MTRFVVTVLVLLMLLFGSADANSQSASRSTFVKLLEIQEMWAVEDYSGALAELDALALKVQDDSYEYALTQQYIAHTLVQAGRSDEALRPLERALQQSDLPLQLIAELNLLSGQLLLADEEFDRAKPLMEMWFESTEAEKQPAQIFSLAYVYYMTEDLPMAELRMLDVLALAPSINDSWYRVYYQILFEQRKYAEAEVVLYDLLTRRPDYDAYWQLLTNHYMQIEQSRDALAALAISHLQGHLTSESELRRLSSLYGYVQIPEKAARLVEQWVADTTLPSDYETLRHLGELWLLARHRDKAIEYLELAAQMADDGGTYQLLGSLLFEDEDWQPAYDAFMHALDLGDLEEPLRVHLLAGVCAFRAGMHDEAKISLEEAKKSEEHRAQALSILRRINEI